MLDGLAELSRRVARLDNGPGGPAADLLQFTTVLAQVTSTGPISDVRRMPGAVPAAADAAIAGSRLIRRLRAAIPEIVVGPLWLDRQYWIGTGKPDHVPPPRRELAESHFTAAVDTADPQGSSKPFHLGLFTSTGVLGGHGMWRTYLDAHEGSSLFPKPWHTWAVQPEPDVAVYEITSAAEWVDFVQTYPLRTGTLTYPDWRSVARDHDAVHMTIGAIAATQGLYFPGDHGIVAAPYWDVESTLWLRWRFTSTELVEVTGGGPPHWIDVGPIGNSDLL